MLNYQLDLRSKQNLKFILPLALVLFIVLLLFILSSFWQLLIIMITALLCLLFSIDIMVWQNHPMTVVGLALPALILVIAIADSIHIISRWNYLVAKGQVPKDAVFAGYSPVRQKKYNILTNFVKNCFDCSQRFKKLLVYGSLIAAFLMLYQLSNIMVETNFLDVFFKKKSVLYQDFF